MSPAGYSGKPIAAKLGFKPDTRVTFPGAPAHYTRLLGKLPDGVEVRTRLAGAFDLIHCFATRVAALRRDLPRFERALAPRGMLWISWPKGTSAIDTDLTREIVRDAVLSNHKQLVDVKVCAVDEDWSALKFVRRRK